MKQVLPKLFSPGGVALVALSASVLVMSSTKVTLLAPDAVAVMVAVAVPIKLNVVLPGLTFNFVVSDNTPFHLWHA